MQVEYNIIHKLIKDIIKLKLCRIIKKNVNTSDG